MDMAELSADGTPHTQPMRKDTFDDYVRVLKDMNLKPVGIANASPDIKELAIQVNSHMGVGFAKLLFGAAWSRYFHAF